MQKLIATIGSALLLALAGCGNGGTGTTDWAGAYQVDITNVSNDCNFQMWTLGEKVTDVPLTLTEDSGMVSAVIGDPAASFFDTALGTTRLDGEPMGDKAILIANGTRPFTEGACTYAVNATLTLTKSDTTVSGTMSYTKVGGVGCEMYQGCASTQSWEGH